MKKVILFLSIAFIAILLLIPVKSDAHSGRTNSSGCHNDNIHGGYHCHNGGYDYEPVDNYVCKINGIKYYSHSSAKEEWNRLIDKAVDDTYQKLLGITGDPIGYAEWERKFAYNNCHSVSIEPKRVWDTVIASEEYKQHIAKQVEEIRIKTEVERKLLIASQQKDEPVQENTNKGSDYSWLWILIPIFGYIIYKGNK